jgi:DNA-binding response OmpR family regulator
MKPKLLIVDDDVAITQQLFWTLCDDYDVTTANDIQTALRRAILYEPAVTILDLHLPPNVDSPDVGLHILEYIKEKLPGVKVVIISTETSSDVQNACFRSGADVVLAKPFEVTDLLAAVSSQVPAAFLGF